MTSIMNGETYPATGPDDEPAEILLVDDSALDLRLAVEALRISGAPLKMTTASSGHEAICFLRERVAQHPNRRSCVVLLDLNMPILDGAATLHAIRLEPSIALTPVIMLTTSGADADVERSYQEGANGYVRKPLRLDAMIEFFQKLDQFLVKCNVLPRLPPTSLHQ